MYKKLLLIALISFCSSLLFAQQLPLSTGNNENSQKTKNRKVTFKTTANQYKNFFSNKNIDKKGSGYKPYKRWEYHWSHYLLEDGTIAPVKYLWKAWEQKQQMSKSIQAISNWTPKGPFSQSSNSGQGRVNTIIVDPNSPNTIYAGTPSGGLWKSTNAGVNWTALTDDLPQIGVSGIAIDPNNSNVIYISTGDDDAGDSYSIGVLKSTDGGSTWNQTGSLGSIVGDDFYPTSNEILIDPTNSNKVWVATGSGLYLSTNAGTSWTKKQSGNIKDFKLKPGDPNTIYTVSDDRFFISKNGGNFVATATGLPAANTIGRLRVEVTPAAPNNVYILATKTSNNDYGFLGVYKSINSGSSFSKTNQTSDIFKSSQAWYDLAFCVSKTDANTMYVGVLDIWKSTNGGNNFTQINDWANQTASYTHADIHFMRYYNGVLYAGTDGGIYKSTNNGTSFSDLTKNMSISQFYKISVAKKNSNKMAGGLQDNGGFSFSNNIWHNYHGGDGMDAASDPNNENTFYGFLQNGAFLTKTTNGGISSIGIASAPGQETGNNDDGGNWVTPLVANKGSEIYAGYSQLYKLENDSWSQVSNHSFGGDIDVIEIDPSNINNIFISKGLRLYISNDKGATFTTRTSSQTGLSGSFISSIEVHNSNSDIVWISTAGANPQFPSSGHTGGGVFKSTDGGLTFTNISSGLPSESKFVVRHHQFSSNNSIYVGTALGVYHRNDDANTWEVFSTNLPNVAVTDLEINSYDNTITAATYGRSVWQSPIPTITLPAKDIDLVKIASPDNSVTCGAITPKLSVVNNGLSTITSLIVEYNVDGGTKQTYNWTGSIVSNTAATIVLPTISTANEGSHNLNTKIILADDTNISNNSSSTTFFVNQSSEGQYLNTFGDVNPDTWLVSNGVWEKGKPTTSKLNGVVTSGYVTKLTSNYPDQTTSHLTSPCYDLTTIQNPILKFKMAFDLEANWDVVYVEYSKNQGANWQVLGTANDPNWYNSSRTNASSGADDDCQNCPGAQWTGTIANLKEYSYNLSALNGESNIIFRFKFISDPAENNEGVVIDDFVIDGILGVNDFEDGEFLIYPNPSSDVFNIKRISTAGENMTINVFDVTGKLIKKHHNITDSNYQLNMNGVAKGIYFLKIKITNKQLVKKLILN